MYSAVCQTSPLPGNLLLRLFPGVASCGHRCRRNRTTQTSAAINAMHVTNATRLSIFARLPTDAWKPSRLLRQSPDWRSEEDNRQVATCPQLGSTNRVEHVQVRPGTHSLISGEVSYTGWTLSTRFGSESASRCSDVCTRWLLNTCQPTANYDNYAMMTVVISIFHV